jgi:hypothetical protein
MNWILEIYWSIGFIIIVASLIVHYVEVLPFLQSRKEVGIVSWLLNIRHGKDLEKYGEFCVKEGKPLIWYNFLSNAFKILIGWMIGWFVLLFVLP